MSFSNFMVEVHVKPRRLIRLNRVFPDSTQ